MIAELELQAVSEVKTCKRGHAMTPANIYIDRKGAKICRCCVRISRDAFIARQPADYERKRGENRRNKDKVHIRAQALINHRKRKFGLTDDAFKKMVQVQNGVCAICLKPSLDRALAVDHCHATGKIRGLLCKRCNLGIGLFSDNPLILRRATNYIVEGGYS